MNKIPSIYSIPLQKINNMQNRLDPNVGTLLLTTLDFYEWVAQSQTLFLLSAFISKKVVEEEVGRIIKAIIRKPPSAGDWQSYWFSLAKHSSEQKNIWLSQISSSLFDGTGLSKIGKLFQKFPNIRNKVKHATLPNPNACRTHLDGLLPAIRELEKILIPEVPTFIIRPLLSRKDHGRRRIYEYEYYVDIGMENIDTVVSEMHLREDCALYLSEILLQNEIKTLVSCINLSPLFYHDGIDGSFPYMYSGNAGPRDTYRYVCPEKQATSDFTETAIGLKKYLISNLVAPTDELISNDNSSALQRPKTFEIFQGFDDISPTSPERFFSGHTPTWSDLANELDVARSVFSGDQRLSYSEFVKLLKSGNKLNAVNIFGEAGSGKTTLLRRLMYDLVTEGYVVLRAYQDVVMDIQEYLRYIKSNKDFKIFLFIDDAPRQIQFVSALSAELINYPNVTLICGSRKNEWNESNKFIKYEAEIEGFYLKSLSNEEITQLISKLEATI